MDRMVKIKSKIRKNETGNVYGKLTVITQGVSVYSGGKNRTAWVCHCECGRDVTVQSDLLRSGGTRSCGCLTGPINETGNIYSRLTVLGEAGRDGARTAIRQR